MAGQVEAGPIAQVGFGHRHPGGLAGLHQQRQADHARRPDRVQGGPLELLLLGGGEAAVVGGPGDVVTGEVELRALGRQTELADFRLRGDLVAQGHAVVVGAEDQIEAPSGRLRLAQPQPHLVAAIAYLPALADDGLPGLVDAARRLLVDHQPPGQRRGVAEVEAERRVEQQVAPPVLDREVQPGAGRVRLQVLLDLGPQDDPPIRRAEIERDPGSDRPSQRDPRHQPSPKHTHLRKTRGHNTGYLIRIVSPVFWYIRVCRGPGRRRGRRAGGGRSGRRSRAAGHGG